MQVCHDDLFIHYVIATHWIQVILSPCIFSSLANERTLRFDAYLGGDITQKLRFTSFEQTATDFECKIAGTEFACDLRIRAAGCGRGLDGEEMTLDVKYEPTNLGDVRDVLVITGVNQRGNAEFRVPLYGHCEVHLCQTK